MKRSRSGSPWSRQMSRQKTVPFVRNDRLTGMRGSLKEHRYSRYTLASTLSVQAVENNFAYSFEFNNIINSAEFSSLYDRYRLDYVIVKFQLINNPNQSYSVNGSVAPPGTANTCNFFPKMWSVIDYDDSSTETIAQIKERSGCKCKILEPNKTLVYKIKPAISAMMYKTATTTGYGPKWGQWIDFQDIAVPHYGLKIAVDCQGLDPPDSQPFQINCEKQYFFTCKDVR